MHAKSVLLCQAVCNPMDCSPPGSSVHSILQERILEWAPCPPPGDPPDTGMEPRAPAALVLCRQILYGWTTGEAQGSDRELHKSRNVEKWQFSDLGSPTNLRQGTHFTHFIVKLNFTPKKKTFKIKLNFKSKQKRRENKGMISDLSVVTVSAKRKWNKLCIKCAFTVKESNLNKFLQDISTHQTEKQRHKKRWLTKILD